MTRRSHPASSQDGNEVRMPRRRATTIAPEGRLVLAESSANSRLFVYMIGNCLHRIERERRTVYFGDLDLARVARSSARPASSRACAMPSSARSMAPSTASSAWKASGP
jgi:hypothetical protein